LSSAAHTHELSSNIIGAKFRLVAEQVPPSERLETFEDVRRNQWVGYLWF
jgi:hypothetical protein